MVRRCIRALFFVVFALGLSGFTGCPEYEDVRRLSSEQLMAQEKQLATHQAYYAAIDKLLDQQVLLAYMVIDDATNEQMTARNAQLMAQLPTIPDTDASGRLATLRSAAGDIAGYASDSAVKKQKIADRVAIIKQKHVEIAAADQELFAAQQELDRWVQTKKVDEVVAADLINKFKRAQGNAAAATNGATVTALDLVKVAGGGH